MRHPLLECRRCGVVGRYSNDLCQPEPIDDACAEAAKEGAWSVEGQCASIQDLAPYGCAVCGRPTVEATNVCYPSRYPVVLTTARPPGGGGGPRPW